MRGMHDEGRMDCDMDTDTDINIRMATDMEMDMGRTSSPRTAPWLVSSRWAMGAFWGTIARSSSSRVCIAWWSRGNRAASSSASDLNHEGRERAS